MGRRPKTRRDPYGAWLHHLRKTKGFTQDQVAEHIGVPQSTLAYWERTGKLPGRLLIIRLARTFGVSVEKLLRLEMAAVAAAGKPKRLAGSGKTKTLPQGRGG